MNIMEIEAIKFKVKRGDYTLQDKLNIKSDVWERFKEIVDGSGVAIRDYVACKICFKVLSFHSHFTGTSSLRKHRCFTPASYKNFRNSNKEEEPSNQQMTLKNMCIKLSPLKPILYRSFLEGASTALTEDSSRYWLENVEEILPPKKESFASRVMVTMPSEDAVKIEADERSVSPIEILPVVCKIENFEDDALLEVIGNQVDHLSQMGNHSSFSATRPSSSSALRYLEEVDEPYSEHKRSKIASTNGDREDEPSSKMLPQGNTKPFIETTNRIYEDEHDVFGRHISNELRSLPDDVARRWARFNIQKTLFEAHSFRRE